MCDMKLVIGEILREFYENGIPSDVKVRHLGLNLSVLCRSILMMNVCAVLRLMICI